MRIARLGAAGAAAGVLALGAAGPAFATGATPAPSAGLEKDTTTTPSVTPGPKAPAQQPTADVNPKFFYGGDTLTFTVKHCLVHPTIKDVNGLFVSTHPFTSTGTPGSFAARETTRKNIVEGKEYRVIVKCGDYVVTFSTKPRKRTSSPTPTTQPTGVPSGAPQTGDGSSSGGGNTGLMAAGAGIVVLGLAGGGFLYTRRRSSAGA
jgi:hypothetical protein